MILALGLFAAVVLPPLALAQQNDAEYGERIRQYTTDPRFLNELVDHLPSSATVPSPLEHLGEVIGTPNILHNTQEIYGYMRALAAASPRAQLRHIGTTEEGRDMIEVIVADEATIAESVVRPAHGVRGGSARDHGTSEAGLLPGRWFALGGDGRARDVDGAGLSARR
jgi:hypothetical protein